MIAVIEIVGPTPLRPGVAATDVAFAPLLLPIVVRPTTAAVAVTGSK
jgi:hypothetical protein